MILSLHSQEQKPRLRDVLWLVTSHTTSEGAECWKGFLKGGQHRGLGTFGEEATQQYMGREPFKVSFKKILSHETVWHLLLRLVILWYALSESCPYKE